MRFMVMHKTDQKMEAGEPPSSDVVGKMGKYVGESIKAGVFKDGAGLHRSEKRARVRFEGGKRTEVVRGPYQGGNELIASFAMVKAASIDEAIEAATRVGERSGGDGEIEVGLVVEPWDIGVGQKPEGKVMQRYLLFRKGDAVYEKGEAKAGGFEEVGEGLVSEGQLKPSKHGARLGRGRQWVDGPFAESKELVAGFSVIEVPTLEDAKRWAETYAEILVDNEVDVREVVV